MDRQEPIDLLVAISVYRQLDALSLHSMLGRVVSEVFFLILVRFLILLLLLIWIACYIRPLWHGELGMSQDGLQVFLFFFAIEEASVIEIIDGTLLECRFTFWHIDSLDRLSWRFCLFL